MNRLATETSPYLRQHAANPVDWFPWGPEAFAAARATDRPVLLSVGYSACHWCHVMAHECFEAPDIAAAMNQGFVNVKVDREERPDVDAIYMHAVQALTGSGGWPMTVFLDLDSRPFFGGTYFPPDDRRGMPGFPRVMTAVLDAWRTRRDELTHSAEQLHDVIARSTQIGSGPVAEPELDAAVIERAVAGLEADFDPVHGGFGGAPKFPPSMTLELLAGRAAQHPDPALTGMVTTTLDAMAAGGLHDQVGGGFHRYSVDATWLVPHFEKMLYDQSSLLEAYRAGWLLTGEPRYRRVVDSIVTYAQRDLRHPEGGFFSAEDADSEGVEGKFYVWSRAELAAVCGEDAEATIEFFGVTEEGNFVDPHTGFRGNVLHAVDRTAPRPEAVERAVAALFAARERRVRPGLDDKVLLAWNARFVHALARAAATFEREDWMNAARTGARFLQRALRRADGRWLRSWQDGRASVLAFADDYASLLEAFLTLAELDDAAWLDDARSVADDLIRLFADEAGGGFFTTGTDAEALIVRPKDAQDHASPAENSLAAEGLLRLAALTGEPAYERRARRWLGVMTPLAGEHPQAFAALLGAAQRALSPPLEIAIVGDPTDPRTHALRGEVAQRLLPGAVTLGAPPGSTSSSPLLADRGLVDGAPTAYVCERYACREPVTTPEALARQLDELVTP